MPEKPSFLKKRWMLDEFHGRLLEIAAYLKAKEISEADMRGIRMGESNSIKELSNLSFIDTSVVEVEACYGHFSCRFFNANLVFSNFSNSVFDTVIFFKAKASGCNFEKTQFKSPSFQDNHFLKCSFNHAKFSGRKILSYGGRRIVFEKCDFSGCFFKNIYLLAVQFKDCLFDGATFFECKLTGVKFENCNISPNQFTACDLKSVTISGDVIDEEQPGSWEDKARIMLENLSGNVSQQGN